MKKVSMQDVADAAGVARSTVSLVLNGKEKKGRIGKDVAKRVRKAAKEMNYQFNEVARSLRTGETRTIALIVADISDSFFGSLAFHIQEYALERGYVVLIFNTSEKESSLNSIIELLSNRKVDGIIMVPTANLEQESIEQLYSQIPVVLVDRYFKDMKTSRVTIDNYKAGYDATELLVSKGCRRIAMLTYKDALMHMQERKRGYLDALKESECAGTDLLCEVEYYGHEEAISRFLSSKLKAAAPIDGLFIATGGLSAKALKILTKIKEYSPENLEIAGFDTDVSYSCGRSIPYIKQPMERMCKYAVDILLNQIKDESAELVDCKLQTSIAQE